MRYWMGTSTDSAGNVNLIWGEPLDAPGIDRTEGMAYWVTVTPPVFPAQVS